MATTDAAPPYVNAYLVKPVEFEQFSEMVKESGLYWLFLNHPPVS